MSGTRFVRREFDGRADRFESEVRDTEMMQQARKNKHGLQVCQVCRTAFEDYSKRCPNGCRMNGSTLTMATVKPIPSQHLEEARRKAHERARRSLGL